MMKMITRTLFFVLSISIASTVSAAKVYKQVGPNGEIIYTDSPPLEGTETVEQMNIDTKGSGVNIKKQENAPQMEEGLVEQQKKNVAVEDVKRTYEVSIDTPKDGTEFGPDTLDIAVGVSITPDKLVAGDRLQVLVDNVVAMPLQPDLAFKLPILPAGEHQVTVNIISNGGKLLGTTSIKLTQKRSAPQALPSER